MNHAARANSNAVLSFAAFTFCGTLPVNQSRLSYSVTIESHKRAHHKKYQEEKYRRMPHSSLSSIGYLLLKIFAASLRISSCLLRSNSSSISLRIDIIYSLWWTRPESNRRLVYLYCQLSNN